MCKRLFPLLICLAVFADKDMQAQVKSPEINREPLSEKSIYRFPAFTDGTVIFRNGIISAARLNYNISLDEMHFINQKGDTLSLADPLTINFISLQGVRFYYDKGYLQIIKMTDDITLAFKQVLKTEQKVKGAFGITTQHPGARTYSFFTVKGHQYGLDDEEAEVISKEYYFFGDVYGHFFKANKEYILDHYKNQQDEIRAFMKTNRTNFNKEADLVQLMQYCSQLVL